MMMTTRTTTAATATTATTVNPSVHSPSLPLLVLGHILYANEHCNSRVGATFACHQILPPSKKPRSPDTSPATQSECSLLFLYGSFLFLTVPTLPFSAVPFFAWLFLYCSSKVRISEVSQLSFLWWYFGIWLHVCIQHLPYISCINMECFQINKNDKKYIMNHEPQFFLYPVPMSHCTFLYYHLTYHKLWAVAMTSLLCQQLFPINIVTKHLWETKQLFTIFLNMHFHSG